MIHAAELTRTGIGLPAYYNDEVMIPALLNRGLTLKDARNYCIIGCVEPQAPGKTDGWHDAAFFNMCRPVELVFSSGMDQGELIGVQTKPVEEMTSFEEFYDAYKAQMNYMIQLLVNSDNAIDCAHMERCPLPFCPVCWMIVLEEERRLRKADVSIISLALRDLVLRIWQTVFSPSRSWYLKKRSSHWAN